MNKSFMRGWIKKQHQYAKTAKCTPTIDNKSQHPNKENSKTENNFNKTNSPANYETDKKLQKEVECLETPIALTWRQKDKIS